MFGSKDYLPGQEVPVLEDTGWQGQVKLQPAERGQPWQGTWPVPVLHAG